MPHFSVAVAGLDSIHIEHVQLPPEAAAVGGGATPAADQSNALGGAFETSER